MQEFVRIPYSDKGLFYRELGEELNGLYEDYWFTNMSNASAALMAHLPNVNWAGFYLWQDDELRLGPFQGLPACLRIQLGHGVCGTAAMRRQPLMVADVELFPGHIACDARSRSEIVFPLVHPDGRLLGVLDIDSPERGRFDEADQNGLGVLVEMLISRTRWPRSFT